ncbi:MAG: PD40 domain-containing protein [Acidobacteria bacterium]|nr:PD40 domain-containing protein [Candidatus Sulfomarinibacter kjeldsenii]
MNPAYLLISVFLSSVFPQPQSLDFGSLAEAPPGSSLQVFGPGVISSEEREHSSLTISPDGSELYFTRQIDGVNTILFMERSDGEWSEPRPAPFNSDYLDDGTAFTPDGQRIYFGSRRPVDGGVEGKEDTDIWYVERTADGWSKAEHLGAPINTGSSEGYPFITRDGVMYFHSSRDTDRRNSEIYKAQMVGERFSKPERLGLPINTDLYEAAPYVDSERGFIAYFQADLRETPIMGLRLSFQADDGSWSESIDLVEKLGLGATDLLMVKGSPDGKYLFILDGGDIYWVDVAVLDSLRPGGNG